MFLLLKLLLFYSANFKISQVFCIGTSNLFKFIGNIFFALETAFLTAVETE